MTPFRTLVGFLVAGGLMASTFRPALAHVVASPSEAPAGSQQMVVFRIAHGCKGSATTALKIDIPDGIANAKPHPKANWTLDIAKSPGADGKLHAVEVTWTGFLPDDQFDEFALLMTLPDKAQTLYFPAVQTCDSGDEHWIQIPAAPDMTGLDHPAPSLTVTPAEPAPAHHH